MLSASAQKANEQQDDDVAARLIKTYEFLFGNRGNWESHWQEIAERIYPAQSRLFQNRLQNMTAGEKRNENVFDSTGSIGLSRFASILDSLLTPQNSQWHGLRASNKSLNKDKAVRLWFESLSDALFKYRYSPNANFASQNQVNFRSLGAYGSACMFVDDLYDRVRRRKDGIRYKSIHLSGVYFRENHQGIIDSIFRYYRQPARNALQQFGEALPDEVQQAAKKAPDQEFYFLHVVEPREDFDPGRPDSKGMPWASYYVSITGKKLLSEGGFRTFPFPTSRYEQQPGEVYGRSPAMDVLPSIKTLNEQKKTLLKQGHRATDPVLLAYDDGLVDGFSLRPGAINAGGVNANGQPLVHALPVGNVQIGKEMMDDERAVINDAFLITLFQILTETPQMTATEVMERMKEKSILIAPTVGRQESEYLGPMIEREIDILIAQGKIDQMPQALIEAKGEYKIEFDSPLARAAKAERVSGYLRSVEMAIQVATQTGRPDVLDFFEFDEIIPESAVIQGMPESWLADPDKVAMVRQQRAQQQQQQQMVQAAPGAAAITKSVAAAQKMNRE